MLSYLCAKIEFVLMCGSNNFIRNDMDRVLQRIHVLDLVLVGVWAVFLFWNCGSLAVVAFFAFPLFLLRAVLSFSLYYRRGSSFGVLAAFLLWSCGIWGIGGKLFCEIALLPVAKMADCCVMAIRGNSSLLSGLYQHYAGFREACSVGMLAKCWMIGWLAWLLLEPVALFLFLSVKGWWIHRSRNRKKIMAGIALYGICSAIALLYQKMNEAVMPLEAFAVWLLLLSTIPFSLRLDKIRVRKPVVQYMAVMGIVSLSVMAGLAMNAYLSLWVSVSSVFAFYYLFFVRWDKNRVLRSRPRVFYFLFCGCFLFWIAQYTTDLIRIVLLVASAGLMGSVAYRYYRQGRQLGKSVLLFLVCALVLPVLSAGYNPYSCIRAKRLSNYDGYAYSYRGLMYVYRAGGVGIRDRFGMIMPAEYVLIESLGDRHKPYVRFKRNGNWGIYDLERQEQVVAPRYQGIFEHEPSVWRLTLGDTGSGVCDEYFIVSPYYNRFDAENGIVSDLPVRHLADGLPLSYRGGMPDAEKLDGLLWKMMDGLSRKKQGESYADLYWEWASMLTGEIDSLYANEGMFHSPDTSRYDRAMDLVAEYIAPSEAGTQAEMNCYSYVMAVMESYKMHRANLELASMLPEVDWKKEYTLYNEYMSAVEIWNAQVDAAKGAYYSSKPMDENAFAEANFRDRAEAVAEIIAAYKDGKAIAYTGNKVSEEDVSAYFSDMRKKHNFLVIPIGYEGPTRLDTIRTSFCRWMEYRDTVASRLPLRLRASYRNQTERLRAESNPRYIRIAE